MKSKQCFASAFVLSILTLVVMDYFWLSSQSGSWAKQITQIQGSVPMYRMGAAVFAYLAMGLGIAVLVAPRCKKSTTTEQGLLLGAVLGLAMYGTFNATNYAIFKNYTQQTAIKDTMWGVFVCAVAGVVGCWASWNLKWFV